jgi:8-oxo-dGTP diphosphatase
MSPQAPVPVVCAVIEQNGTVLLARRPANKPLPLKWEFPGGKVEPGESPETAIVREIREELGCTVTLARPLPRFLHDYGAVVIEMIPFVCALAAASNQPVALEHLAIAWVEASDLLRHDLAPADFPVVASYREAGRTGA